MIELKHRELKQQKKDTMILPISWIWIMVIGVVYIFLEIIYGKEAMQNFIISLLIRR